MYHTNHQLSSRIFHVTSSLAENDSVDPDFDSGIDELEREFAELRLQLPNE